MASSEGSGCGGATLVSAARLLASLMEMMGVWVALAATAGAGVSFPPEVEEAIAGISAVVEDAQPQLEEADPETAALVERDSALDVVNLAHSACSWRATSTVTVQ